VTWEELGLTNEMDGQVRDLWADKDLGTFREKFAFTVESHALEVFRVTPEFKK
jgi:hypothetical protein